MKAITIDTVQGTHSISTKGTFPIEAHAILDEGILWLRRPMLGHPRYRHLELLLLPGKGLQACRYKRHEGRDWFDWYIDIVEASWEGGTLKALDLYADVLLRTGRSYRVLDLDELCGAYRDSKITGDQMGYAIDCLGSLCAELNDNGYRLPWLTPMMALGRKSNTIV